jgi:hypothetical protein
MPGLAMPPRNPKWRLCRAPWPGGRRGRLGSIPFRTHQGQDDEQAEDRLAALSAERLQGIGRGIEKESLRARPDGTLA